MKVKAHRKGFFGGRIRNEGDEFTLPEVVVLNGKKEVDKKATTEATEKQFSGKWMVKV